jgi:23S rRNA (guanosine2251-2'-O)-methyltransferase
MKSKHRSHPQAKRDSKPARPSRDRRDFRDKTFPTREAAPKVKLEIPKNARIVIGTHAILEAIAAHPQACQELWLRQGWESSQDLKKIQTELKPLGVQPVVKAESILDRFGGSHQGAVLFMSSAPEIEWDEVHRAAEGTLIVLDGIEDPHNLGAILRTSWLMGVKGVLIPEDRAVGLTATVHKVACGGAEHVPVETTGNFASPLEELKKQGYWIFGLSHEGKKTIFDLKIPEKVVWCIGAEDKGLRTTTERLCDELVSIPQASAAASYNASVATAIALTETLRQRSFRHEKNSPNL